MKNLVVPAVAALALAGCAAGAGMSGPESTSAAPVGAPMARTAADYVRMAGASDLYEIQSSQAVLQTAQNADVRRFAQMMIDHHTMTTQQVMAGAQSAGMTPPPPALDAEKTAMLSELQGASGTAREAVYVRQQRMAHEQALALHSGYAQSGDNAALRGVAAKAVPIIQQHRAEIQRIGGQMGG